MENTNYVGRSWQLTDYGPCTLWVRALIFVISALSPEAVEMLKKMVIDDKAERWDAVLNKTAIVLNQKKRVTFAERARNDCWLACRAVKLDGGTTSVLQSLTTVLVACDGLEYSAEVTAPFLEKYLDWLLGQQPSDHKCHRGLFCDGCVAMAALLLRRGGELALAGATSLLDNSGDVAAMMLHQLPRKG